LNRLLEGLTDAQREAVLHVEGPLLILAGPGSGKTRVVTHRIARLVEHGIPGHQILALTFTNKAADEMRSRVERLAPGQTVWVGTFHRFCARLLRHLAPQVGLESNYTIYDTADSQRALRRVVERLHVPTDCCTVDGISSAISWAKNNLITSEEYTPRRGDPTGEIIAKVYAAGGMVHIWAWGDHQRHLTPRDLDGGINGLVDRRLQRYIAARLGPIPGWTIGYGFDLWEWVDGDELTQWHHYMHDHFGWRHLLGARASQNTLAQLSEALDYSGYEQHRPDYAKYVETIDTRPDKPSFSEDRFRIRNQGRPKDYTAEETRRGLWHSTMAGGVANIWGNLLPPDGKKGATPDALAYPNKDQIKTYFIFFNDKGRFVRGLQRANELSADDNTRVLRSGHERYIFYRQDAASIHMDLSAIAAPAPAVAVDTKKPYDEIPIGPLAPEAHLWQAPYTSDWAIAVGP